MRRYWNHSTLGSEDCKKQSIFTHQTVRLRRGFSITHTSASNWQGKAAAEILDQPELRGSELNSVALQNRGGVSRDFDDSCRGSALPLCYTNHSLRARNSRPERDWASGSATAQAQEGLCIEMADGFMGECRLSVWNRVQGLVFLQGPGAEAEPSVVCIISCWGMAEVSFRRPVVLVVT